jgi:hypothetical protein
MQPFPSAVRAARRARRAGLCLGLGLVFFPGDRDRAPDELVPARGKPLEGFLVRMDDEQVQFRVGTRDRVFERTEVELVRSPLLLYDDLADWLKRSPAGDVESAEQLSRWCGEAGLAPEAQFGWWRVLAYDWNNAEAHEALGSRRRNESFEVRIDRRWYDQRELYERIASWDQALELDLSLYRVRSSARLEDTLDAAAALVRGFALLYAQFGELFDLPYPREFLQVHLHGDPESFPTLNRRKAYFDPAENRIVADTSGWGGLGTLVHEVSHQLLANAYTMVDDNRGAAPAWLDEGLAEYLAATYEAEVAKLEDWHTAPRALDHLRVHAKAEKKFSIRQVMVGTSDQFHGVGGSSLAYAQAFTLVLFCLEAEDGAFRDRFRAFCRGTFDGKLSATDFEAAMELDLDEIERRWEEFVAARAER